MPGPTPLLNGIAPPPNSFVLPEHKMVYISVTKAACTSLRWMIADLAGEDFQRFYRAHAAHQTRLMTIHTDRQVWQHVPQLHRADPKLVEQISRDAGWFIFAVVRDPWSRLWSGWQSKFLVRHTKYVREYGSQPWFPRVPEKPEDVVEDWGRFIEARPWVSHPLLKTDVHFWPQVRSVRPGGINYTRVYDLTEMPTLLGDIRAHLESVGKARELYLPRANETPLGLTREVLGGGVAEAIEETYKKDFTAFGERWSRESLKYTRDGWSTDAIRHVAFHSVANERIGDLSAELARVRNEIAAGRQSPPLRLPTREDVPVIVEAVRRRARKVVRAQVKAAKRRARARAKAKAAAAAKAPAKD